MQVVRGATSNETRIFLRSAFSACSSHLLVEIERLEGGGQAGL